MMVQIYKRANTGEIFWLTLLQVESTDVMYDQVRFQVGARSNAGQELYVYYIINGQILTNSTVSSLEYIAQNLAHSLGNIDAHVEILKALNSVGFKGTTKHRFEGCHVYNITGHMLDQGGPVKKPSSVGPDHRIKDLPGINEIVKHPVDGNNTTLSRVIQSLNDHHKWTRHRIADWVETLDVDIEFKSPEELEAKRKAREEENAAQAKKSQDYWHAVTKGGAVPAVPSTEYYMQKLSEAVSAPKPLNKSDHASHLHLSLDDADLTNADYFKKYWSYYDKLGKKDLSLKKEDKKLIDDGVVPTTDKWYTLGYVDKLKIEYDETDVPDFDSISLSQLKKSYTIPLPEIGEIEKFIKELGDKNDKG